MWYLPWSQLIKKQYIKFNFWVRWIILSLIVHLCVVGVLFFGTYRTDEVITLRIGTKNSNPQIMCVMRSSAQIKQYKNVSGSVGNVPKVQKTKGNGVVTPSSVKKVLKKSVVPVTPGTKFVAPDNASVVSNAVIPKKKLKKERVAKKPISVIKKVKKSVVSPVKLQEQRVIQPLVPVVVDNIPVVTEAQSITHAVPCVVPSVESIADTAIIPDELALAIGADDSVVLTPQEALYVALQEEIVHHWHPPVGVEVTVPCEIKVTLDEYARVSAVEMVQSSGVLMYDIAVRASLTAIVFPSWARNKKIILQYN